MKNTLPYIYDFLSLLLDSAKIKGRIKKIILFGSVARGDADEESDIDIFIDIWSKKDKAEIEKHVREVEKRFFIISERKWSLLGIRHPIKCIVDDIEDAKWKSIRSEMLSSGMMLFGKFEGPEKGMKHYMMLNYSLAKLKQAKKMSLLRKLFGYETSIKKKKYTKDGLLKGIGGEKLSSNVILIPVENSRKAVELLNSFGVTPQIRDVRIKYL